MMFYVTFFFCTTQFNDHIQKKMTLKYGWDTLDDIFENTYIPHGEKTIFVNRMKEIYMYVHDKCACIERRYFWTKAYLISVGILNPALLTVAADHCSNTLLYSIAYWSIWTLQVSSSVITSYTTMARFDKKHFAYIHYKNRLDDEIWAFVELRDAYAIVDTNIEHERIYDRTFHHTKYKNLLSICEKIHKDMSSHIYATGLSECTNDKKEAQICAATDDRISDRYENNTCGDPVNTHKARGRPIHQSLSDPGPASTHVLYPPPPPFLPRPPYVPYPPYPT